MELFFYSEFCLSFNGLFEFESYEIKIINENIKTEQKGFIY